MLPSHPPETLTTCSIRKMMRLLPERTGGAHEKGTRKRRRKRTHWRDLEARDAKGEFGGFFV